MKIKDKKTALASFEESAVKHADATGQGDYKTANKCYANIVKAINFLKEQAEVAALIDCLCHSSAGVRNWAATYLLPVKEKEAIKVLEEIVRKKDIHSLSAETTLSEWRKGNLKL
ncbi:MAG: DUF2019 domain-containing protein [Chitinophagaceae bacterium]|nr:DUF2019 domain-containing protein [Chitinophagaceae bacterium]